MTLLSVCILILIGLAAGLLAGLLGIGGGIVTVPCLLYFFQAYGKGGLYPMQVAVGTSLGVMLFTAASSAWSHQLKKGILWSFLKVYAPAVAVGATIGAFIADQLPSRQLELLFGVYALFFGVRFIFSNKKPCDNALEEAPKANKTIALGMLTGIVCSALGIGGAPFTVPFLTLHHYPLQRAISTSSAVGFLIALIGSLSFFFFGLEAKLGSEHVGYLYLPAFFLTGLASIMTAPLGAKLTYRLPVGVLKRIFGILLILVGVSLII